MLLQSQESGRQTFQKEQRGRQFLEIRILDLVITTRCIHLLTVSVRWLLLNEETKIKSLELVPVIILQNTAILLLKLRLEK